MEMIYSLTSEVEDAKRKRVPLIIPVGTIEYHGPHCPYGCDGSLIEGVLKEFQKIRDAIIYPTLWYTVGSYMVTGPEKNTMNVSSEVFEAYVSEIVSSLLEGGWKNIYFIIHHQYLNENLQPMTLCCMLAARKKIIEFLEKTRGRGWWGDNDNRDYYLKSDSEDNPFNWIKTIPLMTREVQEKTGYDHAGKYETSFQRYLYPDTVRLEHLKDSEEWFIRSAAEASDIIGNEMAELTLSSLLDRVK